MFVDAPPDTLMGDAFGGGIVRVEFTNSSHLTYVAAGPASVHDAGGRRTEIRRGLTRSSARANAGAQRTSSPCAIPGLPGS